MRSTSGFSRLQLVAASLLIAFVWGCRDAPVLGPDAAEVLTAQTTSFTTHWVDDDATATATAPGHGCGEDAGYTTIGAALSAASAGDTVIVCAGTYPESPTLTRANLTLTTDEAVTNRGLDNGADQTVISGTVNIRDNANNATVEGFKITGGGSGVVIHSGISGTTLSHLTVADNIGTGVILRGNATLEHSTISGNSGGIDQVGNDAVIRDSEIVDNTGRGIDSRASGGATIEGNTISGNTSFGVFLGSGSANHTIDNNTFDANGSHGVRVDGDGGHQITNNDVTDHGSSNGIHVTSGGNTISNNTVSGNADGIFVHANNNTVTGGESTGNGQGLFFRGDNNTADGVRICGNATRDIRIHSGSNNAILNNEFDTVLDGGSNTTFAGNMPCGPVWVAIDGSAGPDDCTGTDPAFTTIQDAVDSFVGTPFEGGTINVCAGTYVENVQVRNDAGHPNNLTIQAVEDDVIVEVGAESNHVFFIRQRTGVTIQGFTIAGITAPAQHAVRLMGGNGHTITDNTFSTGGIGFTHGSTDIAVTHNVFENPGRTAISAGTGWIVRHNVVEQASFHPTNPAAISIGGSGADVAHNEVSNGGSTGIRIGGAGGHQVSQNTVVDSRYGIDVVSDGNELNQNTAEDNDRDGIRIDGDDNELRNSRACGNGDGEETVDIFVVGGANNEVRNSNYDTAFDDGDNTTWRNNQNCAGDRWTGLNASPPPSPSE